ncbi:MAG: hypothetical protein LLG06_07425 [Desulfobacteraceae bacterium]|nr:hypothetical protein [Desulfobacteraceae bacterium]
MVSERKNALLGFLLFCMALLSSGCVVQAPSSSDPAQELNRLFAVAEKVHARAGIYLNEDIRSYVYRQDKSGAPIKIDVGRSISPVCMTMASAIFDSAVEVQSLPPYVGGQQSPDVEVVLEPEILYVSCNASGVLSGQITAAIKLRMKAYDLSGRIIWQGEAIGENQGEQMDVLSALLGNVDKTGKATGQAGLAAATRIIQDFNATKPPELYALLETKAATAAQPKGQKKTEAQVQGDKLFQRGMYQFDKKNYQQALYSFQQSARLNPDDLSTKFYVGVCRMYTGQKRRAVDDLNNVLAGCKKGDSLAANSKQWIQRLNDPLKIGIVYSGFQGQIGDDVKQCFAQGVSNCGMYEVVLIHDSQNPVAERAAMNKYIDEAAKKKARIILFVQADKTGRDLFDATLREGDIASEFAVNASVKAYAVQKKKPIADFMLFDNAARMKKLANADLIQSALLKKSANRMVLALLGNEIF